VDSFHVVQEKNTGNCTCTIVQSFHDAKEKCTQCLHMHNSAMFPRSACEKLAWWTEKMSVHAH